MATPRYPAIPQANPDDPASMAAAIKAMKQTLEILLGQHNADDSAVTIGSLPGAVTDAGIGTAGATGAQGQAGFPGFGNDGDDGQPGIPGQRGLIGPPGFFIPGRDGDDGDVVMIPGTTGAGGSTGAAGQFMWGFDGEDGERVSGLNNTTSPIAFKATLAADQTALASGAFTLAAFATEIYDRGGFYDNSAGNYKWTPPPGLVIFSPCVLMDAAAVSPDFAEVMVFKNGAQLNGALLTCAGASFAGGAVEVHDIANGTDSYDCRVFPAFGAGVRKIFNNSLTHFQGAWLGPA